MDFSSAEDAKAAKEAMEDGEIDGNKVILDFAKPKGDFQRGGGFGGRGGRGGGRGGRGGFGGRGGGRGGFGGKKKQMLLFGRGCAEKLTQSHSWDYGVGLSQGTGCGFVFCPVPGWVCWKGSGI